MKVFFSDAQLLKTLVIRNVKNRYSNTVLGLFWPVVTPLLISLIISFVFKYILPSRIDNFTAFVISGMLPWISFSGSLQESSTSFVENSAMIKQFRVAPELIPATCVIINFLNLLVGFLVATAFFIPASRRLFMMAVFLPVPLILHFAFTLGLSFFVSALYVRRKDIGYLLNLLLLFWLWVSPVFYFFDKFPLAIQRIFNLNPIVPFLNLYRSIFFKCAFFDYGDLFSAFLLAAASLVLGYIFLARQEHLLRKII